MSALTPKALKSALAERMQEVAEFLLPNGRLSDDQMQWWCGDRHGAEGESLKLELYGDKAGIWHDFAEEEGGDILDIWKSVRDVNFKTACKEAKQLLKTAEVNGTGFGKPQALLKTKKTNGKTPPSKAKKQNKGQRTPGKQWDYKDSDGKVIGYVQRFDYEDGSKDVLPYFKPDGKRFKTGLTPELKETRPLYGDMPNDDGFLVIAEGEKATDALREMGFPACTSQGGCGAGDKGDWSRLQGVQDVIIWQDNDAPGEKYANAVAQAIHGVFPDCRIRIYNDETLPESGDVVDWILREKAEFTNTSARTVKMADFAAARNALQKGSKKWEPPPPVPKKKPLYMALKEILKETLEWTWVVEDLMVAGRVYQIHGERKTGKSLTVLDLTLHLSQGKAWNGKRVEQCLVVYVAGEAEIDIRARIQAFGIEHGLNDSAPFVLRCSPVYFTDSDAANELRDDVQDIQKRYEKVRAKAAAQMIHEGADQGADRQTAATPSDTPPALTPLPVVVVIDTLARNFGAGKSESSDVDMGDFINNVIDKVARPLDAMTLIVHHPGHADKSRGRGHSSLPGAVDGTLQVEQLPDKTISLSAKEMRSVASDSTRLGWSIKGIDLPVVDNFGKAVNVPVLLPLGRINVADNANERKRLKKEEAVRVCREAVLSWLRKLNTHRASTPGDVALYPSKADLEAEMVNQGYGRNVSQQTVKSMQETRQLVFRKFPEGVSKRGRGEYIELSTSALAGSEFEPVDPKGVAHSPSEHGTP